MKAIVNIFLLISSLFLICCSSESAIISEDYRTLKTYPFSDPNPIPILTKDSR